MRLGDGDYVPIPGRTLAAAHSHQVFFCWGSQGHGCDQREKRHVAFAHFLCLPLLQMCGMMGSWHETDILGHHFSFIVTADLFIVLKKILGL